MVLLQRKKKWLVRLNSSKMDAQNAMGMTPAIIMSCSGPHTIITINVVQRIASLAGPMAPSKAYSMACVSNAVKRRVRVNAFIAEWRA